jgi:2-polyprenyl-6-hydroxyphenyl methylase/3-demethylubiquinone-9 3-methyltransferase
MTMTDSTGQICLWFQKDAEAAARVYAETFPNSSVGKVHRSPADNPSAKEGEPLTVEFTVMGTRVMGLNGGPHFTQSEAFSFVVITEDQAETDRYWNAIVDNGGQESMCGWCKDKWGVSWQITPRVLAENMDNPDKAAAKRVFEAMMKMKKIDIATLEAAAAGETVEA